MPEDKLTHEAFRQPANPDVNVWRYMDLPKLLSLLQRKELHFSRLTEQLDRYEGMEPPGYYDALLQTLTRELLMPADAATRGVDHQRGFMRDVVAGMFVNCWRLGNEESEAMWRLYCPGNAGVAVQTNYATLRESVAADPECYIGMVHYIDPKIQTFPFGNTFHRAMHKRISFAHESEVRLVKQHHKHLIAQEPVPLHLSVPWDPETHVQRIFVDPYAPEWYAQVVRDVVGRYSERLAKCIEWSDMR